MPHDHHGLAAARDGFPDRIRRGSGGEAVVRFRLAEPERGGGLAGAQERAREDRVGLDALAPQPLAERTSLLAPLGRQRAELVR